MADPLTLSRGRLEDFLLCQRRFQLRYLEHLPWPLSPLEPRLTAAMEAGEQFHQLVQRHLLNLPTPDEVLNQYDSKLRRWWQTFLEKGPRIKETERPLVEMTLTVPVGRHALLGRFDLIVVGEEELRIFDWKTSKPRTADELRQDWQTRLYLALAVEGRAVFARPDLQPEQVSITYWYARQPDQSVTLSYSQQEHTQNWADLTALVGRIDAQLANENAWLLTDDLTICTHCPYSNYCGRFDLPDLVEELLAEDRHLWDDGEQWAWEPETPNSIS